MQNNFATPFLGEYDSIYDSMGQKKARMSLITGDQRASAFSLSLKLPYFVLSVLPSAPVPIQGTPKPSSEASHQTKPTLFSVTLINPA